MSDFEVIAIDLAVLRLSAVTVPFTRMASCPTIGYRELI